MNTSTIKPKVFQLFSEGHYTDAFDLATEALQFDPDDVELMMIVGLCLYRAGINDMAYMWLKKALEDIKEGYRECIKGLYKKAHECIGRIAYACKRDYIEATIHFREALGSDPIADKEINMMLGIIAHAQGDYSESLRHFVLSNGHTTWGKDGQFSMALSCLMFEDLDSARNSINKFLEFHKDYLPAQFVLDNIGNDHKAGYFKRFIIGKTTKAIIPYKIGKKLKAYAEEIAFILQKRGQCWHTACLFNDLDGLVVYSMIRELQPRNVIEFSPYMGYSTVFLYKALAQNGKDFSLTTFDIDERAEFRETMKLFDIPLSVQCGDALQTVPKYIIDNGLEGKIDLCFVDSDHSYEFAKAYIDKIFPLLGKDCIIAIHDMYYCPDKISMPFDHYSPIIGREICETIMSIGEARAVREFFSQRDDYVLLSTHKLFGGMAQCAPPLPLNKQLLREIDMTYPFLSASGGYWALAPMMILSIPRHIWQEKDMIFRQ